MQNILVATDFSNNAYCALFYAKKLLESKPCTFYILNVYDELTPLKGKKTSLFGSKKSLAQRGIESKERLNGTLHKIVLDDDNPRHTLKTLSQKGILSKIIVGKIGELNIDLLVMGNKGRTEATDIFFGSNTIRTVKHISKCPVLAIPGEMNFKPPKEIAFVTDFEKDCTVKTLAPLLYIAALIKASVRVVHINEERVFTPAQEANRKHLKQCLKTVEHSFHEVQEFDDKAKVIDVFLEKQQIDLYAMVNYKHNLFEKLTHEPIIKDVSMYADIPFFILPPQD